MTAAYMYKIVQDPQKSSIWGEGRGREVRRRHHEMTIKGRSRIEATTKEATDAVTETIKNVRKEA
jgi:hypothetical protein